MATEDSEEEEKEEEEKKEEKEEEEEPSLLDVIATYRHDADKIIILARSIETILHYTERLEENAISINNYIQYIYEQLGHTIAKVNDLDNRFKSLVDFQIQHLQQPSSSSSDSINPETEQELRNEITGIRSKIVDLESTLSSFQSQLTQVKETATIAPAVPIQGVPPIPPTPQGSVVEENLLKPSSFGSQAAASSTPKSPTPMGGMSVRMAMMQEIKVRLGKSTGVPPGPKGTATEMGSMDGSNVKVPMNGSETKESMDGTGEIGPMGVKKEYVPKIHQPREAKVLDTGLVGKMNKLLDQKFEKQLGGTAPTGPPSTSTTVPPKEPPNGPPKAPPSAAKSPPIKSKQDSEEIKKKKKEEKTEEKEEIKEDKKKEKKKDKKKEEKKDRDSVTERLASIDAALKDKLG